MRSTRGMQGAHSNYFPLHHNTDWLSCGASLSLSQLIRAVMLFSEYKRWAHVIKNIIMACLFQCSPSFPSSLCVSLFSLLSGSQSLGMKLIYPRKTWVLSSWMHVESLLFASSSWASQPHGLCLAFAQLLNHHFDSLASVSFLPSSANSQSQAADPRKSCCLSVLCLCNSNLFICSIM